MIWTPFTGDLIKILDANGKECVGLAEITSNGFLARYFFVIN